MNDTPNNTQILINELFKMGATAREIQQLIKRGK